MAQNCSPFIRRASEYSIGKTDVRIISIEFASTEENHAQFFGQVVDVAADPVARSANASGTIVILFPSGNTGDSGGTSGGAADTEDGSEDGVSEEETTDISVDVSLPVTWTEEGKTVCYVTFVQILTTGIAQLYKAQSVEEVVGIEGYCAQSYFSIFNKLITNKKVPFTFELRTKRPPLDPINAVLSFVYTLATSEIVAALETVGLDSYIGDCHALRRGRVSIACELVEEARCLVERFVITLLNLQILGEKDFEQQVSGAVWLNGEGRKKTSFALAGKETIRYGASISQTKNSDGIIAVCPK